VLQNNELKKESKKVMAFVGKTREDFKKDGESALALSSPFSEWDVLTENSAYISAQVTPPSLIPQFSPLFPPSASLRSLRLLLSLLASLHSCFSRITLFS
jgi:hypothetical protein